MLGHMGTAGWSSTGLAAPGWSHDYCFYSGPGQDHSTLSRSVCRHSRYHLLGSPGASGLSVPQLITLLLSAFLGESVFSPDKVSLPRDQLNLHTTTLFPWPREHVEMFYADSPHRK